MEVVENTQQFQPLGRPHHPSLPRHLHLQPVPFNLHFAYSNPKPRQSAPKSHPSLQELPKPIIQQVPAQGCQTFYPRKHRVSRTTDQMGMSTSCEMDYIRCGFPQRKKKTGEQQFLKLLMKFAEGGSPTNQSKQPLFEEGKEKSEVYPRIRMRQTMGWVKKRYCVNRDKEKGMFMESGQLNELGQSLGQFPSRRQ